MDITHVIGWCAVVGVLVFVTAWIWMTFVAGKTGIGKSKVGKYITAVLRKVSLVANLRRIEIQRRSPAVKASPAGLAACATLSRIYWADAENTWELAQADPEPTPEPTPAPAAPVVSPEVAALQKQVADLAAVIASQGTSKIPAVSAAPATGTVA